MAGGSDEEKKAPPKALTKKQQLASYTIENYGWQLQATVRYGSHYPTTITVYLLQLLHSFSAGHLMETPFDCLLAFSIILIPFIRISVLTSWTM